MDLIIDGKSLGPVKGYRQNRSREQWVFLMEAGYYVSVDWYNMKSFTSSGALEVLTYGGAEA